MREHRCKKMGDNEEDAAEAVPAVDPIEAEYEGKFSPLLEERAEIVAALEAVKDNFSKKVGECGGDGEALSMLQMKSVAARDYHMCARASRGPFPCALDPAAARRPPRHRPPPHSPHSPPPTARPPAFMPVVHARCPRRNGRTCLAEIDSKLERHALAKARDVAAAAAAAAADAEE